MENSANNTSKHSGLGIASFIISLAGGFMEFVAITAAGILEFQGRMGESSPAAMIVGLFIIFGLFVNLAGVGLGIAAVAQNKTKKIFGVFGIIFNGGLIILILGLIFIGLMLS